MADIFDEVLGSSGGTDPAAIAEALRRKNKLGMLAELSGDKVLSPMGQRLQAGAFDEAVGSRKMADERSASDALAKYRQGTLEAGNADRALRRSIAEANNARALEVAKIMAGRQHALSAAQAAAQSRHDDQQLAQLANRLGSSNLGVMAAAVRKAQAVLDRYPEGDIPGVGGIENLPGAAGMAATYLPGGGGDEARKNKAELADFQNLMLLIRSGQAVTDPELQRALVASGLTVANTSDDMRKVMPGIISSYDQAVQNLLAGYRPELIDTFRKRGGLANYEARHQAQAPEGGGDGIDQLDDDALMNLAQQLLQDNDAAAAE